MVLEPEEKLTTMDNTTGRTALALVVGIAAGAALGILFAPRSGKKTRAALLSKGEDLQEDLEERIDQARKDWSKAKGKVADAASMTKEEVTDFVHYMFKEGKRTARSMKDDVSSSAHDVADRAKRTAEDYKQAARAN